MPQVILTNSVITNEALLVAKNAVGELKKRMNVGYAEDFAKKGHKIGDTLNVRLPMQYTVGDGEAMTPQDTEQKSVPIVVNSQKNIGMQFGDSERTLKLDNFRELYIEPAVTTLVDTMMSTVLENSYKSIANYAGIPHATNLPNSMAPFSLAKAKMLSFGAPARNNSAAIDQYVEHEMTQGMNGLFNPSTQISKQFLDGEVTRGAGLDFLMSQVIPKHTIGALGGTPLTNGATADGATTLALDGASNSITGWAKAGDVIQLGGVFAVNPITKKSTGKLMDFVVTADANSNGSGVVSLSISPAINASGAYQNVTNVPADNSVVTFFGHASSYAGIICPQNLVFHKSAIALCVVPLEKIEGEEMTVATDPETGLSVRLWTAGNILSGKGIKRLDILFGSKVVRPDFAARVVGRLA
ncbi:MAG: hypothetical protein JNL11_17485 [Bdellovibrionaceae bacterium]|nr:hypothetical protein [Pseudobdellovibrionaceae bacterium]